MPSFRINKSDLPVDAEGRVLCLFCDDVLTFLFSASAGEDTVLTCSTPRCPMNQHGREAAAADSLTGVPAGGRQ